MNIIIGDKTCWLWTAWFLCYALPKPAAGTTTRGISELPFPEDSETGLFFALAVPLDDPVSTKAISVAFFFEANYRLPDSETEGDESEEARKKRRESEGRPIDRRTIYAMLESKFESFGFPGKACVLRSICETARHPLYAHNGVLGDLFRILLTPSSSVDEGLPREYANAENQPTTPDDCGTTYPLCPLAIYDYITTKYE